MHEMALVTEMIAAIEEKAKEVEAERVCSVTLRVGEFRDIHLDLLQKYFEYFTRETVAEGMEVTADVVPARYVCERCGSVYHYDMASLGIERESGPAASPLPEGRAEETQSGRPHCFDHPDAQIRLITGLELEIIEMAVL